MTCKHCSEDIPDQEVRTYVASLMGKTKGKSKARDSEKMRSAGRAGAFKRWKKMDSETSQTPIVPLSATAVD